MTGVLTFTRIARALYFIYITRALTYLVLEGYFNYEVAVVMSLGVIIASQLAARIVNRIDGKILRIFVGILALIISTYTLWKYF